MQDDQIKIEANELKAIKSLVQYGKGFYLAIGIGLLLFLASSFCMMGSANLLGILVEGIIKKQNSDWFMKMSFFILALESIQICLRYGGKILIGYITNRIALNIRCALFEKLTRLPIFYYDRQPLGRTLTRLTTDVEGVEDFFSNTLTSLILAFMAIFVVFVAMLLTDLKFGAIVTLSALPALIITIGMRKPATYWMRVMKKRNSVQNSRLAEFLNGMMVVKIFGLENWTYENMDRINRTHYQASLNTLFWNSVTRPISVFFCSIPTILILWLGGQQVLVGTMTVGIFVAFARYSERFLNPIVTISQEIQKVQDALTSSERIRQMFIEPEEQDTLGGNGEITQRVLGQVSFRDIDMEYQQGNPVLNKVNFDIRPGTKVALVGETGSGKSSTLHLIPRLYPFKHGEIMIDNLPIKSWNRTALRSQLGIVSQDVMIFRGTLRQNLIGALNADDASSGYSDAKILAACDRSGLSNVWHHFSQGLDSMIVDGGENLSMGERQLIAFTRMFIRDPAILLLDEATASIDKEYESLIHNAIDAAMVGRTCFTIAHRLSTVVNSDLILVFSKGKIVERGSHNELMLKKGYYAELAKKQELV